ncbi:hypothetical protein L2E82_43143 [Cichorium intybus]|uniref:Uncharacterized protein n=1 Tax=Cichorium intybus TaxID=13427 RepID=A0ACB8ZP63_CICIN|nr:hypothetical protein L2E82_43143 [Cichorium intybus]
MVGCSLFELIFSCRNSLVFGKVHPKLGHLFEMVVTHPFNCVTLYIFFSLTYHSRYVYSRFHVSPPASCRTRLVAISIFSRGAPTTSGGHREPLFCLLHDQPSVYRRLQQVQVQAISCFCDIHRLGFSTPRLGFFNPFEDLTIGIIEIRKRSESLKSENDRTPLTQLIRIEIRKRLERSRDRDDVVLPIRKKQNHILVGLKAWRNSRDSSGLTPYDYASLRGHYKFIITSIWFKER